MNRGKTKNFYKYKSSTDTQFHLKTNLLLEKTFRIQPAEREQKEAKNPSTSNSQTLPSRLIPIQFHSFQKKKKETKGKRFDKIFLSISSILGPCSSFHRHLRTKSTWNIPVQ